MWDPAQRDAVAAAFHAASPDVAPAVTAAVDAAMVRFRDRWAAARVDACRLGAAGAARASCLDVLRIQADTLVGLLRRADAALVDSAVVAAARLPDPATCARPPAPVAEAQQAQVRALDGRLAELRALASAQRSAEAEALATEIYEEATAAGLDRIRASALSWRGSIQPLVDGGEGRELADFRQALAIATSIGDDVVAAEVLGGLSYAYSQQGRHDLADLIDLLHASTLTAIGGDPVQEASRAVWACQRAWIRGEGLEDGLRRCHDARRQLIAAVGEDDYRLPELDVETGNVLYMLGRYEEAIVAYRTANEGFVRLFGPRTVRVHAALGNMADTQIRLGRPAEAIATLEALVARDPAPPFWDALALARRQLGELDEALEAHRQGARSAIAMDRPSLRCQAEVGAAEVLLQLGRDVEATRTHRGAEEVCAGEIGSLVDRGRLGWVRARLLARGGDLRGARRARDVTLALLADAGVGNPAGELRAQVEAWDPVTERATP
jgi:tetratricopeptide (TPR) repeat protein